MLVGASACGRGPFELPFDRPDQRGPADCDRADFLFVIDDSPSMQRYQSALVDSFPEFVGGVDRAIEHGTDLHVGVVTTDEYIGNPSPCNELGGLVIETAGANSSRSTCGPYAEGANYMTEADDLEAAFACAAMVGTLGNQDELPLGALVDAVDSNSAAAKCNAGFVRDDALLVAVILTDESDNTDSTPESLADRVIDAKGGAEESIVVVSLLDHDALCGPGGNDGYPWRMEEFTKQFEYGFVGPICEDYDALFEQAIDIVADACAGE